MELYTLIWILVSVVVISLFAIIGVLFLSVREELLNKVLLALVAFSAGALMGGALLHMIPKTLTMTSSINTFLYLLLGFSFFFLLENVLQWRHCHDAKCDVHTFTYMNLIGDGIHNITDGFIIAASFVASIALGFATTLAVAFHEIPQEIGDFGVLVYGGFEKRKALIYNYISAITIIPGAIVGYLLSIYTTQFIQFMLPIAAGGFIYIAASDLIPELRKETSLKKSAVIFGVFLMGIILMYIALSIFG
ncbi:MAG: ZIP family metal transporter [Candidatus Lokiarchaeia archaeon]